MIDNWRAIHLRPLSEYVLIVRTRGWDVRPDRMSQGLVRRDPDIVADEGFSIAENNRVRIERHIRDPNVRGEGGPAVSRLSIEDIYQMVLGIEPSIVEVDAE